MKLIVASALAITTTLFADPAITAIELYATQKQEESFRFFLEEMAKPVEGKSVEEDLFYNQALRVYLDPSKTPRDIAKEILETYSGKEGVQLGFLLAVSYANQGDFEKFFKYFWASYQLMPNHFLAYKARAVLHIKLLERAATPELKSDHKRHIVELSKKALELEPNDHSLYRFVLSFADDKSRSELLEVYLNKIIINNIITPRVDILFYVRQAVDAGQYDLAKRYLEKTRNWYKYSRSVQAAEDYLDRERKTS